MDFGFWKVESIGNDFPLIRESDGGVDLAAQAMRLTDRHFGIGGDGLLTMAREDRAWRLRMFNPDGTEDFCGNGIRAAARWAHEVEGAGDEFTIRHLDREIPVRIDDDRISTEIGVATYDPDRVPVSSHGEAFDVNVWSGIDAGMPLSLFGSVLSTGSTHTIIPTAAIPDDDTFASVSAKVEVDPKYPQRTSVIWRQEVSANVLRIRIWERGVGETQGCGTGSSAAAADYLRHKGRGGTVQVQNPGGTLEISMDRWDAPITVTGAARVVYHGRV